MFTKTKDGIYEVKDTSNKLLLWYNPQKKTSEVIYKKHPLKGYEIEEIDQIYDAMLKNIDNEIAEKDKDWNDLSDFIKQYLPEIGDFYKKPPFEIFGL